MKSLGRRIERLEERAGIRDENPIKAIKVLFVEMDGTVSDTMIIDLDQRRVEG